jgi:hypothetical protein
MTTNIKSLFFIFAAVIGFTACKKTDYAFGDLKTPANLALVAAVAGADAANPNGNGTGAVVITGTADNTITYKIDFGDGKTQLVPSGTINYKYSTPGTTEYTVTVNAIGTGGTTSTISKKIKVFVAFEIPAAVVQLLTNGSSKTWVTDKEAGGHFGVGAADGFTPNYYSADPNSRQPCAYDDEISFIKDAAGNVVKISMAIDNKGQSFAIGAASAFYGFSGGDNCFDISTAGAKKLSFMNATSASTTGNSTRIQFEVPGNGIINFGTGGTAYEILSLSATSISLRNIGADGNAWYQKLKAK